MTISDYPFDAATMLDEIKRIVAFGIRRPGSPANRRTEQHLLEQLRELGLYDCHTEPVPVHYWNPATTRLTIGSDGQVIPCFAVPYTAWTDENGITAESVYVGSSFAEDGANIDVTGKIVVADIQFGELNASHLKSGSHFIYDPNDTIPDGPLHCANWLIQNLMVYFQAWDRGAAGFIGLLNEMPIDGCELYVPYDGYLKKLPAAWIGREHAETIRQAATNRSSFHFTSTGETTDADSHNIIGYLPGQTAESILITCHHDAPFASAVEDASGLSVLLALAAAFSEREEPLNRSLIFLASSGHFHGGIGCREFVKNHANKTMPTIVAAIGVEHISEEVESDGQGGYRKTGLPETRALFMDQGTELIKILEEEVANVALDRTLAVDAYLFGSEPPCDSAPFFTAGIPSVCHISAPLYLFDPHDTVDKVRQEDLAKVAQLFYRCIERIDSVSADDLAAGMTRKRNDPPAPPPPWFLPPNAYLKSCQ
jgi:hypothetical protein